MSSSWSIVQDDSILGIMYITKIVLMSVCPTMHGFRYLDTGSMCIGRDIPTSRESEAWTGNLDMSYKDIPHASPTRSRSRHTARPSIGGGEMVKLEVYQSCVRAYVL